MEVSNNMAGAQGLLSRVADAVYWMGRYIERAENVARFLDVNHNLSIDLPDGYSRQWQPVIDTTGDSLLFRQRYGVASQESVTRFLAFDPEYPNSVYSCIRNARENARSVRETISSEMWQQINDLYLAITEASRREERWSLPALCQMLRMGCHLFTGILHVTMSHNEAWHFIRLGTLLERADKTSRILDVKYFILLPSVNDVGTPYDDLQWTALLKSVSGFEMYRKRYGRIVPESIVDFLLLSGEFPRSVRYCVSRADLSLRAITGASPDTFSCASEQRLGMLRGEVDFTRVEPLLATGLHEFCDGLQTKLNTIGDCILTDFLDQRLVGAGRSATASSI
jgi:uncharacterized alpha-E superfamily protein